ncbi:DNA-binding CsgD family transcriptional regulator [Duganella sp. SG902]|uniref:helix-turn-helix transcriptional regulator n=1 Tax=Duganella sp. SG902 TaxID=2587016 RepID=UPI00159E0507|nr:helix-turn-helix transcriptional regulator [Duganella sp. SG902]NVM76554.1 DNA-binding CsgD family transcriptional regulator [Duganella sp. SG902]
MQPALTSYAVATYLDAALNRMDIAVFLVDAELRLLHANAAAAALLERDTALRRHGDKLLQDALGGERTLAQLVATVLNAPSDIDVPHALSLPRQQRQPLLLTVVPYVPYVPTPGLPSLPPCAIVMASDPETHRLPRQLLMELFDLTPAEAGVAQALAHGEALEDIAAALDISMHTVKTHLQKLFRKTGTRRQGELVSILHGMPAACVQAQSFE